MAKIVAEVGSDCGGDHGGDHGRDVEDRTKEVIVEEKIDRGGGGGTDLGRGNCGRNYDLWWRRKILRQTVWRRRSRSQQRL